MIQSHIYKKNIYSPAFIFLTCMVIYNYSLAANEVGQEILKTTPSPSPSSELMRAKIYNDNTEFLSYNFHSGIQETQRHDLENERLINFRHKVLSTTSIGVSFTTGSEECYGVRVVLEEKDDSVGIAVVEGNAPGSPDACTRVGKMGHFIIHTKTPIGDRKIILLFDVKLNK